VGAVHEECHSFHVKDADVHLKTGLGWGMVFNATFNNISVRFCVEIVTDITTQNSQCKDTFIVKLGMNRTT
jgi:hypothetical protein